MRNLKLLLVSICLAMGLIGCASTGGAVGGLFPVPKLTKGQLENGVYTAQDMSFSVRSPFEETSYEYTYMAVAENYNDSENTILFSSSAAPAEVYRVNILKDINPEEELETAAFASYRQKMEGAYNTPFENDQIEKVLVSGVAADLRTYSQYVPERSSMGRTAHELDVLHSCVYVEQNSSAAFICVNRVEPGARSATEGSEVRLERFLGSFRLK